MVTAEILLKFLQKNFYGKKGGASFLSSDEDPTLATHKEQQGMSTQLFQDQTPDFKNEIFIPSKEGGGVPSGFVLKLYQMVNNAPDEVISVSTNLLSFFCNRTEMLFPYSGHMKVVLDFCEKYQKHHPVLRK